MTNLYFRRHFQLLTLPTTISGPSFRVRNATFLLIFIFSFFRPIIEMFPVSDTCLSHIRKHEQRKELVRKRELQLYGDP
jgi:hypothetical protein